jgi:hypothetical protein
MSAARKYQSQQEWWDEEEATQAIPVGRGARASAGTATLHSMPRTAGHRAGAASAGAQRTVTLPALPDPSRYLPTIAIVGALAVLLYFGITSLYDWTQVKMDDLKYGRPRTSQLSASVGHNEANGALTHFVAMNLNRQVTVIEFPGGDVTKPRVIVGPYLFGRAEDLTVVKLRTEDVNGDEKKDLLVQVKDERLVYINDGTNFRPITAEELAALKQQEGGR